jgi:hypothetical protein
VRVKVVLEDVGARENGAKARIVQEYSFAYPITKLQKKHL